MLINTIKLNNFLSFGEESQAIPLKALNVIIGPNGSGKSNLLEAIELLRNAPEHLLKPIREGGGVRDWLWKGAKDTPDASLDVVVDYPQGLQKLRYVLSFTAVKQRFEIVDEKIENEKPFDNHPKPYFYYHFNYGRPTLNVIDDKRTLKQEDIDSEKSILSQRRDPDLYPEITYLARKFAGIKLYREWSFGRYTAPRTPQKTDQPNEFLEPDASNLGLVLNRLQRDPLVKKKLLEALRSLYDGIDDYYVQIEGGTVQVFFHEGRYTIPATRLSDGTLRYLCLLAILCHPSPPPLVCIEEPELGLHPDVLPTLADLMKNASTHCQLIVTTHSDILVDAMSDQPESVLVAEKKEQGTTLTRLNAEKLQPWLEKYRLGQLWTRGEIGGTRW
ncbi:MAG TPA: AAA family ATPase [Lentisphaeria bacterium]|nr:AAA family ATPase [Lentisphaerota bacterium]OQC16760.1 MAG: recombination protein F [Lentisphaerae bacterium ADurb.Bin082]HPY89544.1 AAA family ATPase [Lentisphaeria bacterium]HQL86380.1 AAA family ATPase [Lentisphaeria bacterium]